MLETYFFIPANNQKFIKKSIEISSDFIIYDLEESITNSEMTESINNLKQVNIKNNYYIRSLLFNDTTKNIDNFILNELINLGFKNFVLPKISSQKQLLLVKTFFENIKNYKFEEYNFILLVENPSLLICLKESITNKIINIKGIGFGSHDYCNIMGMQHTLQNLYFARHTILNIAKTFDLKAIDIVSLCLMNDKLFCDEALNGFSMGFDGKFIIHPKQLELLKKIKYFSDDEVIEAQKVYPQIITLLEDKKAVLKINGKIYEKPHINNILKIINWNKQYESK